MNPQLTTLKTYLEKWFPEFQYRPQDDLFLESLEDEFPHLDLLDQIKTFHAWCLDRAEGKSFNYRLTLRKWLANSYPNSSR